MKKVLKVAALGASVIALASAASAADLNLNIYGASAQGTFWNTYAETFLTDATNGMGCAGFYKGASPSNSKLGITVGYTCANNGNDDVIIRYNSVKSSEGPRAVMKMDPDNLDSCGSDTPDPNRTQATFTYVNPADKTQGVTWGTACLPVHVGASDVASESFTQVTTGRPNGTYSGSVPQVTYDMSTAVIPGEAEIGTVARPIIVPFAFFANTNLAVNEINRQMALLLFSGNVSNWNQFNGGLTDGTKDSQFENKRVVLCMRHAGSGTHATLDKAIMRDDLLLVRQEKSSPIGAPGNKVLFHESSSNMIDCVDDNGGYSTAAAGAIGYADADAIVASYDANYNEVKKSAAANVKRLGYNGGGEGMNQANMTKYGYSALKYEILNGRYEFWAPQWMYIKADNWNSDTVDLFDKLMAYASGTTLPCPGLGCYWATADQMKVTKESDSTIPHF